VVADSASCNKCKKLHKKSIDTKKCKKQCIRKQRKNAALRLEPKCGGKCCKKLCEIEDADPACTAQGYCPTANPTASPSASPTANPAVSPTTNPTAISTASPTVSPTDAPTTSERHPGIPWYIQLRWLSCCGSVVYFCYNKPENSCLRFDCDGPCTPSDKISYFEGTKYTQDSPRLDNYYNWDYECDGYYCKNNPPGQECSAVPCD